MCYIIIAGSQQSLWPLTAYGPIKTMQLTRCLDQRMCYGNKINFHPDIKLYLSNLFTIYFQDSENINFQPITWWIKKRTCQTNNVTNGIVRSGYNWSLHIDIDIVCNSGLFYIPNLEIKISFELSRKKNHVIIICVMLYEYNKKLISISKRVELFCFASLQTLLFCFASNSQQDN